MKVVILNDAATVADYTAELIAQQIERKANSVLGLATGSSPLQTYQRLIQRCQDGELSFSEVSTFNLDEYFGLAPEHPQSYRYFMQHNFFNHIDIQPDNTEVPSGLSNDPWGSCADYEQKIVEKGGIDLQLLGIGSNGHIGFNEPSSSLASRTRVKTLTRSTVAANARFFAVDEFQPELSLTMGIGTILEAKHIVLIATGSAKAEAVRDTIEGPLSARCPASALQLHQHATLVIDQDAAALLQDKEFYLHIEQENQKLIAEYYN